MAPAAGRSGLRLFEQFADLAVEDRLRLRADEALDDLAVAVDQERGRQAEHGVVVTDTLVVDQVRVGDPLGLDELADHVGVLVGDRHDREALVGVVQLLEHRDLLPAGRAPGGPEVDQANFAGRAGQGELRPVDRGQREVGRLTVPGRLVQQAALGTAGSVGVGIGAAATSRTGRQGNQQGGDEQDSHERGTGFRHRTRSSTRSIAGDTVF